MPSKAEFTRRTLRKALRLIQTKHPNDSGQSLLARAIGVKQPLVWYWLHKANAGVPKKYWHDIEKAVDSAVEFRR